MRTWPRMLTAGILIAIVGAYPLLAPPPHRIDQAHFDRIDNSMTRGQVEAVFGVPPGEYDWAEENPDSFSRRLVFRTHPILIERDLTGSRRQPSAWTSRHGAFWVHWDEQDRVFFTTMMPDVRIVPPWQRWWRSWTN